MRPEIIHADLPSRHFEPHVYGVGAWTGHLHFGYDLVAKLKPRLLVELGVDRGESYFAFCQAAAENQTGTQCFAIDSWRGDSHAGGYDETTFAEVAEHNHAYYESFSTLLRSEFEGALAKFSNESIDLLHLDGFHTEEAVRQDVASWLPKLHPGAILLLHDVGVRKEGFGVWKIWEELRQGGRSWTFEDGPGLGVWQKPPAFKLPALLETLLNGPDDQTVGLTDYYRGRANDLQTQMAQEWVDGTIRHTPFARQTIVQVFHSNDGLHRPDDSISARIGHNRWKEVAIQLPANAGAAPLRIDFVSAFTLIDIARIDLSNTRQQLFFADDPASFARVKVAGDATRISHPKNLRLRVTGPDPQLYLPDFPANSSENQLRLELRLRVFVEGMDSG